MSRIRQLDASVINKIAAGEVIERPASVVKELLENSIDALATRIEVDIADGGSELIRIVDDGEGIHPDDLRLAFASHATSKIGNADDLFEVQTMGFRGEALASIAEVSQFRVRTRRHDADAGAELEINCGRYKDVQPCGCPAGTVMEVRQLFANTPVRRKFLKTTSTEFGHVSEQFTRIALSNPRLHMVLRHNKKTVYELPATDRLVDRLNMFYGRKLAENLIWVESESEHLRIWGYVAHPSHSKATRKGQHLFLNGRWIQDRTLQHALREAYRGILMTGRQPIAFLFFELSPSQVDVNVHPTKVEVRFRDSQLLYRQLLSMLRTKFLGMDLNSALDVAGEKSADAPPAAAPDPVRKHELQRDLVDWATEELEAARSHPLANGAALQPVTRDDFPVATVDAPADPGKFGLVTTASLPQAVPAAASLPDSVAATPAREPETVTSPGGFQAMQVHDCYLVLETEEGVALIDQHALHERIMYEHLRERVLAGSIESQGMLVPETVELSPRETALLLENVELLEKLGFGIQEFGNNTILLNRYPVMLGKLNLVQLIRDIVDQLDSPEKKPTRRDILDELLHMMSCKAAVKAGQRLAREEIESLLASRHLIDDAHHCPHGRPTALVLTRAELDKQFGRLG